MEHSLTRFPLPGWRCRWDRLPDTPHDGNGVVRAYIVAFQAADTTTNQPVAVTFPNSLNTPPGVNMELDTLDPVVGELVKYGTGTVSGDGLQIVPDLDPKSPGHRFGIVHFDWHGPMPPPPPDVTSPTDGPNPTNGDPVDVASGVYLLRTTEIELRNSLGRIGIDRMYRTLSGNPGPFGIGSSHNYYYQLNTLSFIQGQKFVTLVLPDGNQIPFNQQSDGTLINSTCGSPKFKSAVISTASTALGFRIICYRNLRCSVPSGFCSV